VRELGIVLASHGWSFLSETARKAKNLGVIKPTSLNAGRVLSVGNLQVGGAGKTPLVAEITREACQQGMKVAILSRGYRSPWERTGGVIAPNSKAVDPFLCGDEPALLQDLCPQAWIGVGADRRLQYNKIIEQAGTPMDWVILDDGFQHWKIKKDLEIVAVTSFSWGAVFFRDWMKAITHANLVVWTKGAEQPEFFGRPWVKMKYVIPRAKDESSVWLVSGVAAEEPVFHLAIESGYHIVKRVRFEDHYSYRKEEVQKLLSEAAAQKSRIALTGKDWVKWRALGVSASDILVLEPKLIIEEGRDQWERVLWGR
jgi:tetraacyldisaccharide 4'-kinase